MSQGPKTQRPATLSASIAEAAVECKQVLSDGQWHSTAELQHICKRRKVGVNAVLDELFCAVSDHRTASSYRGGACAWVCIPDERTPELAPGDTEHVPDVLRSF